MTRRSGRDLVVTLMRIWQANGCLTTARHKALDAHLARLAGPPPRPKPGSCAWPGVRRAAERQLARGTPPATVTRRITTAQFGHAQPPSPAPSPAGTPTAAGSPPAPQRRCRR